MTEFPLPTAKNNGDTNAALSDVALRPAFPVVEALQSEDRTAQAEAKSAAQNLLQTLKEVGRKKQSVEEMMSLLLTETRAARRRKQQRIMARIAMVLFTLFMVYLTHGKFFTNIWVFFAFGAADQAVGKRRSAVEALSKAGDPRAVGVLAVALRDGDHHVRKIAMETLENLLPQVRASDAAYIAPDQMDALLRLAHSTIATPRLIVALLKALEQIGDERAVPIVEELSYDSDPRVRRAAEDCKLFLTERVRQGREKATLLRASSAQQVMNHPEQLLRPASGGMHDRTPPDQLLRSVQTEGRRTTGTNDELPFQAVPAQKEEATIRLDQQQAP